jgi:hypothetical protein
MKDAADAFMGIFGMHRVTESPDSNVEKVRQKLLNRSIFGLDKYKCTTERTDLTQKQWLIHAQEEALDLAVYLQKLIELETE